MSRPLPLSVHDAVWPADQLSRPAHRACPTGFAALDDELPGGGWPTRGLTELLVQPPQPAWPLVEWSLLLPGLRAQVRPGGALLLIGPPLVPHGPGLLQAGVPPSSVVWVQAASPQERLWATEQVMRGPGASRELSALVAWLPQATAAQLRRLQTWALPCDAPLFVVRPASMAQTPSAAPLRLQVGLQAPGHLGVRVLKRRGPAHEQLLQLPAWPAGLEGLADGRPSSTIGGPRPTVPDRRRLPAFEEAKAHAAPPPLEPSHVHALDLSDPLR